MPPTDSDSIKGDTRSRPADESFVRKTTTVPSSPVKTDTRSSSPTNGATVPSSITASTVSRYSPQRVRASHPASESRP